MLSELKQFNLTYVEFDPFFFSHLQNFLVNSLVFATSSRMLVNELVLLPSSLTGGEKEVFIYSE